MKPCRADLGNREERKEGRRGGKEERRRKGKGGREEGMREKGEQKGISTEKGGCVF